MTRTDRESPAYRREQAVHALNCAIACMMHWPPDDEHLGAAVFFTGLALHRMAQADVAGVGADTAERWLARELERVRTELTP